MSDNEIIKALECCGRESCFGCPYHGKCHQGNPMIKDALGLITRLQAENENLAETVHNLTLEKDALFDKAEELKAEIERLNVLIKTKNKLIKGLYQSINYAYDREIKEFAEKMKDEIINDIHFSQIEKDYLCVMLNNLVKEMVGEGK